jgi:DNA-binding Xre family transcriptional regulator
MLDYSPLWQTMKQKGISQYQLINLGIEKSLLERLRKNQNITAFTIEKLCKLLECTPNDIITFQDEK